MKQFIIKIQVPLVGNWQDGKNVVLVYNEDQSIMTMDPAPKGLKKVMGGALKKYFYAHIDKNKMLNINEEAPEQDW